jgi:hypothetical protein
VRVWDLEGAGVTATFTGDGRMLGCTLGPDDRTIIASELAQKDPETYRPAVAATLNNLGILDSACLDSPVPVANAADSGFADLEIAALPGWINDAHQLEPFKLALVKTELEGRVGRRLLSRV